MSIFRTDFLDPGAKAFKRGALRRLVLKLWGDTDAEGTCSAKGSGGRGTMEPLLPYERLPMTPASLCREFVLQTSGEFISQCCWSLKVLAAFGTCPATILLFFSCLGPALLSWNAALHVRRNSCHVRSKSFTVFILHEGSRSHCAVKLQL